MRAKRKLLLTAAFTALLGVGALAGVSFNKEASNPTEVKATDANVTYSGTIGLECQQIGNSWYWDDGSAKIAFYLWKDGGYSGWTNMITCNESRRYTISYSFEFDPFGASMHLVRFNSSHSDTPDWSNIWNRIDNKTFGQVVYIYNDNGNANASCTHTSATYLGFNSFESSDKVINRLSETKYNDSNHWEFYKTGLTLSQGDYGKVALDGSDWCNGLHDVSSDYFWIDNEHYEKNIVCNYYSDSYDVYFDITNKNSYISIPDRAVAEKWGKTFKDTVTCSGTAPGAVTSPDSAWNVTMKGAYNSLTKDQQGKVWTANASESGTYLEQAVYRYDFILRKYGTAKYENFINRSYSSSGAILINSIVNDSTGSMIAIIAISATSLAAVGGYFLFRKKKEN